MAILKVACMGNPVLRQKAEPLTEKEIRSPDTQRLIDSMVETLREYRGVGLAAPQVHESRQVLLAEVSDEPEAEPLIVINPEITSASEEIEEDWEGCLSIPDIRGVVPRHASVRVRYRDRNGSQRHIEASGFAARILQHEIDHLYGVLFLDRMRDLQTLTFLEEYVRYWNEPEPRE